MAQRYRKIDPRVWDDEKFFALSPFEKLVAMYIVTAQSNRCGLFIYSHGRAMEHTGIPHGDYAPAFDGVCKSLGWSYDPASRTVFIPTWWKYNPPENEKHLKGCLSDLHDLPNTKFLGEFRRNTAHLPNWAENAFPGLCDSYGKAMAYQEQEQKQEQKEPPNPRKRGDGGDESKNLRTTARAQNGAYDATHSPSLKSDEPVAAEKQPGKPLKSGSPQADAEKCRTSLKSDDCPSPGFAAFWSLWPKHERKQGKTKCWRKWKRDGLDSITEQVLSCLRRCKVSRDWTKNGGEFIPQPMTWLNKSPWETDPSDLRGGNGIEGLDDDDPIFDEIASDLESHPSQNGRH